MQNTAQHNTVPQPGQQPGCAPVTSLRLTLRGDTTLQVDPAAPAAARHAAQVWLLAAGVLDLHRASWGETVTLRRPPELPVRLPGIRRAGTRATLRPAAPGGPTQVLRLDWSDRPGPPLTRPADPHLHLMQPADLPGDLLPCLTLTPGQALTRARSFLARAGVQRAQLSDGHELFDLTLPDPIHPAPAQSSPGLTVPDPSVGGGHALLIGPPQATLGRLWLRAAPGPDAHAAAQALFVVAHAANTHTAALRQTRSARLGADLQRATQLLRDGHALPEATLQAAMRLVRADGAALISLRGGPLLSAGNLDWSGLHAAQRYLRPPLLSGPSGVTSAASGSPVDRCSPLLLDLDPDGLTRTLMLPLNSGSLPQVAWVFQMHRCPQPWLSDTAELTWDVLRAAARDPIHAAGPRGLERRAHQATLSPTLISVLDSVGDSQVPSQIAGRGLHHLLETSGAHAGALLTLPPLGLPPAGMPAGTAFSASDLTASAGAVDDLWTPQAQEVMLGAARAAEPRQQALDLPDPAQDGPVFLSVTPVVYAGHVSGVLALLHRPEPPAPQVAPLLNVLATEVGRASERQRSLRDLAHVREKTFRVLGRVLEYRSYETKGHTDRVTELALQLGQALDLTSTQLAHLRWGAYLHDLGKIAIPDDVLHKQGLLSSAERQWMRQHVTIGETLLREQGLVPPEVLQVVRHHHERWDGQGYPDGLSGHRIPLLARLFAVVDIFDALTSERSYKAPWSPHDSMQELRRMAGTHLDPALVQAFMDLMASRAALPVLPEPFDDALL
ncbi:HD-GYP domain-containing protein [Deinococcus knuensis]|uniref:HD-GYP domain-containing protein n=1 Tax=Deinococcus knuensis TaxID=1837380 RepID=A0ABQ2SW26_9DEIO|nr:HD-GYP domain-containing protein [Deinococcus knuensis]GGS40157.1 hypothetical protein GCM10008961_34400 [Deinococcus knuensis]